MAETTSERLTGSPERPVVEILEEIKRGGALPPNISATQAVEAVMCALACRLSGGEAADLTQAMPGTLHQLLDRCTLHRAEKAELLDLGQFLHRIGEHLGGISNDEAARVARAVFTAVQKRLPPTEIEDASTQLPSDIRELWWNNLTAAPR